jgi:hypothetical protein
MGLTLKKIGGGELAPPGSLTVLVVEATFDGYCDGGYSVTADDVGLRRVYSVAPDVVETDERPEQGGAVLVRYDHASETLRAHRLDRARRRRVSDSDDKRVTMKQRVADLERAIAELSASPLLFEELSRDFAGSFEANLIVLGR